jgi:hypothetical protein
VLAGATVLQQADITGTTGFLVLVKYPIAKRTLTFRLLADNMINLSRLNKIAEAKRQGMRWHSKFLANYYT